MRYIYTLLIAFSVLTFSGGLSISKHYCAGDLVSKSLNLANPGCEDMKIPVREPGINKVPCCLDENSFYQSSDYEVSSQIASAPFILNQPSFSLEKLPFTNYKQKIISVADPPPDRPVYLMVRHLLI